MESYSVRKYNLFNFVPRLGFTSLQGGRSEMEDVVGMPNFIEISNPVLTLDLNEFDQTLSHSTTHFFGVANYCQDRIHLALDEEFNVVEEHLKCENVGNNWQEQL
ncbi:hypothetical protein AgCh_008684 [Apium graveolens]